MTKKNKNKKERSWSTSPDMVQNVVSFIMLDHATSIENAPVHYHSRWTESCKLWSICRQILFIQSPTRSRWTIETHVSSGGGPHMLCVWSARGLKELNLQRVIDWLKKSEEERGNFSISDLKNIYTTIIKTFHCGRSEVAPLNWAFWRHSWGWICVPNGNRDVEWKVLTDYERKWTPPPHDEYRSTNTEFIVP